MQQRFAEGVDRLDFQPARRFQRLGEKTARLLQLDRVRDTPFNCRDTVFQGGVGERGPIREAIEDAARHFRGRRLGIGQAQNGGGTATGQQQTDHPLRQDMRLARTRIGRHPCRAIRIGGAGLLACRPVDPGAWLVALRAVILSLLGGVFEKIIRHRHLPVLRWTIRKRAPDGHTRRHRIAVLPGSAATRSRSCPRAAP